MAWITKYIDSSEVEAHVADGWTVTFCRFYGLDKIAYTAMKKEEGEDESDPAR